MTLGINLDNYTKISLNVVFEEFRFLDFDFIAACLIIFTPVVMNNLAN
jgi:hypothetical protein